MSFIIDKQTLEDLGIFSRNKKTSIFAIYDSTRTRGGSRMLEEMFANPLDNVGLISRRSSVIAWFRDNRITFPFPKALLDASEQYLAVTDERTMLSGEKHPFLKSLERIVRKDSQLEQMVTGIGATVRIFGLLDVFMSGLSATGELESLFPELGEARKTIADPDFSAVRALAGKKKLTVAEASDIDGTLRYRHHDKVRLLLDFVYLLDVYISVAGTASSRGFVSAEALPKEDNVLELKGVFHPALAHPVSNDMNVTGDCNVIFLTGANMAGKSTFMKTLGIAVFLAHLGFPVPAKSMRFSVRDGLFTTINLPDALNRGYSHFYAEVRRLRKVAQTVRRYPHTVVIFDELFRGTNVKDAFDATVAVTEAFSEIKGSIFLISTHIIEAGEELKKHCGNISYLYLPTEMDGSRPVYTYRLKEGITSDRHGMVIIRNEGILDILR